MAAVPPGLLDVILVLFAIRSLVRRGGPELLERHWPGDPAGLALLRGMAGGPGVAAA